MIYEEYNQVHQEVVLELLDTKTHSKAFSFCGGIANVN